MSKVAIQGNASGTGTFTIAAPNSNTDRTLTLPDEAGTVLTSASKLDASLVPSGQTAWPAFRVGLTSDQNVSSNSAVVLWDVLSTSNCFTQGGMSFASGVMSVPVDGIYQFNLTVRVSNIGSGYVIMYLLVNNSTSGNEDTYVISGTPSSSYENLTGSATYKLTTSDNVRVRVDTSADTSWNIAGESIFSGSLIAAE